MPSSSDTITPTDGSTRPEPVQTLATPSITSFCTSEQMDLWRQVFAEADHRARRLAASNHADHERTR
jgi:hypothetical protein